jgi:tetrahydromethanopterin S-methyltransferase subunit B
MKYNFESMTDFEVIAAESQLVMSIESALVNMVHNDKIEAMYEELEEVQSELERRNLDSRV